MKKIVSLLAAGLVALGFVSCVRESMTVFDASKASAPVLNSYDVAEDGISATYTPGAFNQSFNQKMPVNHSLVIVTLNGKSVMKTVTASVKDGQITATTANLSRALIALGCNEGDSVDFDLVVRASMQEVSKDNGRNGFVDSEGKIPVRGFVVTIPVAQGNPWKEFTVKSAWGLIGSIASTGNSWNADGPMYSNEAGTQHVAMKVLLTPEDQFKVRKDGGWDVNFGAPGETEPFVMELDTPIEATANGKNLAVPAEGYYDLLLDTESGTITLYTAFETYPGFDEISTWSVIGHIDSVPMDWNKDIQMTTDGEWHVAEGVVLTTSDQFKFRKDCGWDVNFGAPGETEPFVVNLDEEYSASQGGKNLAVPADGTYDLLVNPDAALFKVVESLGGKSPLVGGDTPEPPAPTITGWNIIGLNGDWENDIIATQNGNVWTAYVTAESDTEFKWRKDAGWDENYGGTFVALGEPFEAVPGGDNIKIGAGFWKVELNTEALTITISNGQVWSLIGDFNEWGGDLDMTLTDGKWVSPVTKLSGGFKIRENHGWDNNRGGTFVAVGQPFAAVAGGDNISVEEGNYVVTYDPQAETIVIDETGWGLVGTINGWGSSPDIILKEDGLFLVAKNVALTADDEIKIRYNADWAVNRGGRTAVGHAVKAVPGGDNIKPGVAGNYDVWYRPDSDVLFVLQAGSELVYWGVVGTINSWGAPDRIMYENENGQFVYEDLELSATDEIKIRQNETWSVDRGGIFADLGEAFDVTQGGPNVKVGRAAKVTVAYDPAAEKMTLSGEYSGEAPSFPETMYIIGEGIGGWDWAGDYIVDMTPVNGKPGQFWAIRTIEGGKGFKFCAVKEWAGDFYSLGEDIGFTTADGNCFVAETGVYMVYVDCDAKKICVEKAQVYGIGDCFGGWDQGMATALFTEEGGKLTATVKADGELRMYAASTIATSDWWTREFIILDGKIAYRGNGGDQERVSVKAGSKVTLDFNAGTGTIESEGGQGGAAAKITIDGDMSDWANVQGVAGEGGTNASFKVASDESNLYFYVKRTTNRIADLWGGAAYHYYTFDLDNNPDTGVELWGNGPYEMLLVIYPYAGSADAPAFGIAKAGTVAPEGYTVDHAVIKGVVTDSGVETEIAVPRADLMAIPTTPVKVTYWSNKDGSEKLSVSCSL